MLCILTHIRSNEFVESWATSFENLIRNWYEHVSEVKNPPNLSKTIGDVWGQRTNDVHNLGTSTIGLYSYIPSGEIR